MRKRFKKIKDLTIAEIKSMCDKRKSCNECPLLEICGIPFGAITRKQLKEDSDYENN